VSSEGAEEDEAAAAAARTGGMGTGNPSARRFAAASHPRRPALSSFWHFNEHMVGLLVFISKRQQPSSRWAAVPARMLCAWQTRARPAAVEPACTSSNKIAELGSDLEREMGSKGNLFIFGNLGTPN
jgi:hypothetical protein